MQNFWSEEGNNFFKLSERIGLADFHFGRFDQEVMDDFIIVDSASLSPPRNGFAMPLVPAVPSWSITLPCNKRQGQIKQTDTGDRSRIPVSIEKSGLSLKLKVIIRHCKLVWYW